MTRADNVFLCCAIVCGHIKYLPAHKTGSGQTSEKLTRRRLCRPDYPHLYTKTNILPRQARDKHRESTQKTGRPLFEQCRPDYPQPPTGCARAAVAERCSALACADVAQVSGVCKRQGVGSVPCRRAEHYGSAA